MPSQLLLVALCCSSLLLGTACEHATTLIDPLAGDSIPGDGTVQRATLTITITVTGADSALASLIGSPGGVLCDAEVTIERSGSTEGPQSGVTDASGKVAFEGLLPGTYAVSLIRLLMPEEVAQFESENADVNAFGGGKYVTVEPPSTEAAVPALAGRRGSLVISEHFPAEPSLSEAGGWPYYDYGLFLEFYNNTDTTIYLDGKVIASGVPGVGLMIDHPDWPCETTEKWRNDPEGIWSPFLEAFPGSGQEYALAPGGVVVVATDGIDHRPFHPGLYDLSHADFEFIGSSDVDNPSVPNMINIGIREYAASAHGHGFEPNAGIGAVLVLAEPLDVSSLAVDYIPGFSDPIRHRIPAEKVLDVLSAALTPEAMAGTSLPPYCAQHVHRNFDRQRAQVHELTGAIYTVQRRVLGRLPGGRVILQRTKTSSRDFHARATATPGNIP
ncbi:MAG: DUF4876 domain-containing protein [Gemmatimonadota bacterium]|nr:MAG: DUF4876 domain-containing protein [Gemmatimonadota bacterium]